MQIPESWQFLGGWWWTLHVIAVGLVFYVGYLIGHATAQAQRPREEHEDNVPPNVPAP
jgi:hypothetical protein